MAQVSWTAEAEGWLHEIHEHISLQQPAAALEMVLGILDRASTLADFPQTGTLYRVDEGQEIRILMHGHYRIAYLIASNEYIVVLGVFHDAMDLERYLR